MNSIQRHGMRRNFTFLAMRFIHNGAQFIHGEGWYVIQNAIRAYEITAVRVDLDPVRTKADLLTNGLACLVRTVDELNTMWHLNLPGISLQGISAGYIHGAGGNLHPRTGNDAVVDGFLQISVSVSGAFGLNIANGGKAILKGPLHRTRPQNCSIGGGLLEQLDVIVLSGDIALKQRVRVRIDKSGKTGAIRKVNHLCACCR